MKKFIFTILLSMIVIGLNAQIFKIGNYEFGYFYGGPKFGLNVSTVSLDAPVGSSKSLNMGFQLGITGKIGLTDKLAFQPELVYTSKGYGVNNSWGTENRNYKYIGLPVLLKYSFMQIAGMNIYGEGGFYTNVLAGVSTSYGIGESWAEDIAPYTIIDFGFNIGTGFEMPFYGNILQIDFQISQGVVDTYEDLLQTTNVNTSVLVSASYLFNVVDLLSKNKTPTKNEVEFEIIE